MQQIIVFALAAGLAIMPASANSETATPTAAADPEKKKCRKIEVTGSWVKKGKVCRTPTEWRESRENNNYLARKMVEDGTTKSTSN